MTKKASKSAKAAKRAPARRRVRPSWLRPALIFGTTTLSIAGLAGGAWWLWSSGIKDRSLTYLATEYRDANVAAGLVVGEVLVSGRRETDRGRLLRAIDVKRGDLILAFDPAAARRRIEALGWVKRARVERRLPDMIEVALEERRPIVIWQHKGRFQLVDDEGAVIGASGVERFPDLKLVVGKDAPRHARAFLEMLARQPTLMDRVKAAIWTGGRRWNLRFRNGIEIRLPEKDPASAWDRLARYEREHGLTRRDISAIDLRSPDRVVVRVNERRAAENVKGSGRT